MAKNKDTRRKPSTSEGPFTKKQQRQILKERDRQIQELLQRTAEETAAVTNEILDDLEYSANGGWRGAVNNLIYQLRVSGGHWYDEATDLGMLAQRYAKPSLYQESEVLKELVDVLAHIRNQSKADLTEQQQVQLKTRLAAAIDMAVKRRRDIPEERKKQEKAVRGFEDILDALAKPCAEDALALFIEKRGPKMRPFLRYLYNDGRLPTRTIDRAAKHVYGRNSDGAISKLKDLQKDANKHFAENTMLFQVSMKGTTIWLEKISGEK
jgi:hypothetical protein